MTDASHARPAPIRPRVVIVGGGFGGLAAAKALAKAPVDVTVIDRRNHHLFQPLLYQVATAGLAPTQIACPIRAVLRHQANTRVVLAEVTGVDLETKTVVVGARRAPFDYLILATGVTHAYFGHDDWAEHAPGLKTLDDALAVRRRVLAAFEAAELACDADERESLLTFVVVGGGPTGVELAGAIAELSRRALMSDFRAIREAAARVLLVEAGPRLLPTFDAALSAYARKALTRLGVEVRLGEAVTRCDAAGVALGETEVGSRCVFWAAGVRASAAGAWLGQGAGRVEVGPDLSLTGAPEVFVIGDVAKVMDPDGRPVPGLAPAAKQQGEYVGALIAAAARGRPRPAPFRYRDFGALATIGRGAAVVQFGPVKLTGPLAWLFWSAAHIYFLIGFRNRIVVSLDWFWAYLTFERGARLITGEDQAALPATGHTAGRCECDYL